jgi:hypothetical protein
MTALTGRCLRPKPSRRDYASSGCNFADTVAAHLATVS